MSTNVLGLLEKKAVRGKCKGKRSCILQKRPWGCRGRVEVQLYSIFNLTAKSGWMSKATAKQPESLFSYQFPPHYFIVLCSGTGFPVILPLTFYALSSPKRSIIVPIHKKRDKTDCNNYRGISILPTTYKILSNILLSRLIPYAKEIIGDHQCGFRRNRSTIDQIFYIRQVLEKKW